MPLKSSALLKMSFAIAINCAEVYPSIISINSIVVTRFRCMVLYRFLRHIDLLTLQLHKIYKDSSMSMRLLLVSNSLSSNLSGTIYSAYNHVIICCKGRTRQIIVHMLSFFLKLLLFLRLAPLFAHLFEFCR